MIYFGLVIWVMLEHLGASVSFIIDLFFASVIGHGSSSSFNIVIRNLSWRLLIAKCQSYCTSFWCSCWCAFGLAPKQSSFWSLRLIIHLAQENRPNYTCSFAQPIFHIRSVIFFAISVTVDVEPQNNRNISIIGVLSQSYEESLLQALLVRKPCLMSLIICSEEWCYLHISFILMSLYI